MQVTRWRLRCGLPGLLLTLLLQPAVAETSEPEPSGLWWAEGGAAQVEIALARAEARCGVIRAEAAEEIARRTDVAAFDFDLLRRETDPKAKTAVIGPAGERKVLFAAIMNDRDRAAGRAGVGAVMGRS